MRYFNANDRAKENCPGPFYSVDIGADCGCELPEKGAPALIRMTEDERSQSYFYRQPETTEELQRAVEAVNMCPIHDLRYGGTDPRVIEMLNDGRADFFISFSGSISLKRYDCEGSVVVIGEGQIDE